MDNSGEIQHKYCDKKFTGQERNVDEFIDDVNSLCVINGFKKERQKVEFLQANLSRVGIQLAIKHTRKSQ